MVIFEEMVEPKTTIELTEDDATLFREYQKDYYWFKTLKEQLERYNIQSGYITFHFTNLGEIISFDVLEKFNTVKIKIPI